MKRSLELYLVLCNVEYIVFLLFILFEIKIPRKQNLGMVCHEYQNIKDEYPY